MPPHPSSTAPAPAVPAAVRRLLVAVHFVCPLLFFTDLTRNPYVTQIALLNVGLLAALAWTVAAQAGSGELRWPRTPLDLPLLAWAGVCTASWAAAYFRHVPFFRESILAEGTRGLLFLWTNALAVFALAALASRDCPEEPGVPVGRWVALALVCGGLWACFPQLRQPPRSLVDVWSRVWDPFGAMLWAGGLAALLSLTRAGTVHHYWHAALLAAVLAAAYGIAQYFGLEPIWPKVLNPYGGRSVSSFGNPNFMSSYAVMALPLAAVYYLQARGRWTRAAYAAAFLILLGGLLSSLTRSSWIGAAAALAPLFASARLRARLKEDLEFHGLVGAAALVLLFAWPQANVEGYRASFVGRLTEAAEAARSGGPYSPWHQRVLIWSCAWMMGAESPLLGKGWGLLELFYPFYQGHMLDLFELFRSMRTHANNAHNELLELWSQTGILGLGAAGWVLATFLRAVPWRDPWMLAAASGVLGMLVDNLLNVSLHFAVPAMLFWWQAGAVMGRLAHQQGWYRALRLPSMAAARGLTLAAAVLAGAGAWHWARYWNREVHYFMGFKAMRRGPLTAAVEILEKAHRWHPREVNANYELGNAYARLDRLDKAAWAYREALSANAGYDEIYFNLATVLGRLGDPAGAEKHFMVARAINPLSQQVYEVFSRLYLADPRRHREACVELLEAAVRHFPRDINFLNNLGYLRSLGGEHALAEAVYARALRLRPDMGAAEQNLRLSLAQSRNAPPPVLAAVEEFRRLEARLRARDYGPESLRLARRAAAEFPDFHAAHFYLGNLELANGNPAAAEAGLLRALEEEPGNVNALLNLAQARRAQGKAEQAAQALLRALELEPGNAQARQLLQALGGP